MKKFGVVILFYFFVVACKKEPDTNKQVNIKCYSQVSLCDKKYNEVCFLGAHNAFNYKGPFSFPNQNISITKQLGIGVRCFMLDVYKEENQLLLYHTLKPLGAQTAEKVFGEIKTFMESNPNEVITLIIQNETAASDIGAFYKTFGLEALGYVHKGEEWPTLGEMVTSGQRLVTFVERGEASLSDYPFILDGYQYMFENEYEHASLSDFDCDENRGSNGKKELYLLNHWIGGIGDENGAKQVNKYDFLYNQAKNCMEDKAHIVNFIALDFADIGDGMAVVNKINNIE